MQLFTIDARAGPDESLGRRDVLKFLQQLAAGGKRSYSDLAPGSYQAEAAEYAEAKQVKAVTKDGLSIATFGGARRCAPPCCPRPSCQDARRRVRGPSHGAAQAALQRRQPTEPRLR